MGIRMSVEDAERADSWFKRGLLTFDETTVAMAKEGDFAQFADPKRGVVLSFLYTSAKKIVDTNDLDQNGLCSFIAAASRELGGAPAAADWFQALEDLQKPDYDEHTIKKHLYEMTQKTGIAKLVYLSHDKMMKMFLELSVCWAIRLLLLRAKADPSPAPESLAAALRAFS